MKILAISGSVRKKSSNTALLNAFAEYASQDINVSIFRGLDSLPIFSPDQEDNRTPAKILEFVRAIQDADALIISCPEYVHAIPGGIKNAIDWLVSRQEIIDKPIALLHASHRGEDMLASLRLVLKTVSKRFNEEIFARFSLMKMTPEQIQTHLNMPAQQRKLQHFMDEFSTYIQSVNATIETSE